MNKIDTFISDSNFQSITAGMGQPWIDSSIISGINDGDESSFRHLYDSYFSYLCAVAATYIIKEDAAIDVVNDLFANIWNRRGQLRSPMHAYLLQGVRNGCLSYLRSALSERKNVEKYTRELLGFQEEYLLNDKTPVEYIETEELRAMIEDAVNGLPMRCRIIFTEYLYSGRTPSEIAVKQGISVNTVRVQIKIAFDKLRSQVHIEKQPAGRNL